MRAFMIAAALTTTLVLPFATTALAQARQQNRPPAVTDPAQAGPDYQLQGEYAGFLYVPGRGNEFTGLQVIALGDGKFDAIQFHGGLPGNGWDRSAKIKLSGEATGGRLMLAGADQHFI